MSSVFMLDGKPFSNAASFPLLAELDDLLTLRDGWRFGEGKAPDPRLVSLAKSLYSQALRFDVSSGSVTPLVDGGVEMDLYAFPLHIELYLRPNNTFSFVIFENDEKVLAEGDGKPVNEAPAVVAEFGEMIRCLSDCSTTGSTSPNWDDSTLEHLKTQPGAASPFIAPVVRLLLHSRTAHILLSSIRTSPESRPCTGNSTETNSLPAGR